MAPPPVGNRIPRDDGDHFPYPGSGEIAGTPATSGTKWVVKNHLELKNAQRVTIEGNLFENNWVAGQAGYSIMLTPRNSGSAPWTRVQDVSFTHNIVRHVASVVNIAGFEDSDPTARTEHITFRNNLFEDVNVRPTARTRGRCWSVMGQLISCSTTIRSCIRTPPCSVPMARRCQGWSTPTTCRSITSTDHGRRGEPGETDYRKSTSPGASSSAMCWRVAAHLCTRRQMHSRRWRSGMQGSSVSPQATIVSRPAASSRHPGATEPFRERTWRHSARQWPAMWARSRRRAQVIRYRSPMLAARTWRQWER